MRKFKQIKKPTTIKEPKKVWNYSECKIDLDKVAEIKAQVWDNAPELNAVFEAKRYKAQIDFYYKPTKTYKDGDVTLWGYCSDYHTFRNNRYKQDQDPHKTWYENTVDNAKDFNNQYSSDAVVMHGCLGITSKHKSDNGFGNHNMPRYTVDVMHSLTDVEHMMMQLHMEDMDLPLELDSVKFVKTKSGKVRIFHAYLSPEEDEV